MDNQLPNYGECLDCGSEWCRYERGYYCTEWECAECGAEGCDNDEDAYGCMAVPWGFLL